MRFLVAHETQDGPCPQDALRCLHCMGRGQTGLLWASAQSHCGGGACQARQQATRQHMASGKDSPYAASHGEKAAVVKDRQLTRLSCLV